MYLNDGYCKTLKTNLRGTPKVIGWTLESPVRVQTLWLWSNIKSSDLSASYDGLYEQVSGIMIVNNGGSYTLADYAWRYPDSSCQHLANGVTSSASLLRRLFCFALTGHLFSKVSQLYVFIVNSDCFINPIMPNSVLFCFSINLLCAGNDLSLSQWSVSTAVRIVTGQLKKQMKKWRNPQSWMKLGNISF